MEGFELFVVPDVGSVQTSKDDLQIKVEFDKNMTYQEKKFFLTENLEILLNNPLWVQNLKGYSWELRNPEENVMEETE